MDRLISVIARCRLWTHAPVVLAVLLALPIPESIAQSVPILGYVAAKNIEYVSAGGLMALGPGHLEGDHDAAKYVTTFSMAPIRLICR